ncbi:MAG: processing protein [Actinomycetota bacterium]|nr:processing protein [Actinomycetota bacterium]
MSLDERSIAAATLASLHLVTPPRVRRLLDAFGGPVPALAAVREGRVTHLIGRCEDLDPRALARRWSEETSSEAVRAQLEARGARVWIADDDGYPIRDPLPDRPPVLLGEGDRPDAFEARRVAIVGTRSATPHGLADARELGGFLAGAGVTVVSGLAIGVDAAAHLGALDAGGLAVGVVATGLDVVYPRRHRALYTRVREQGLVVGEHGYGVQPRRERFPVRNRIIAALADIVVVVEATATGGARITAKYAAEYGRDVFALPGSRRNPAAAGCNALLGDGAEALLDPGDLLIALGRGGSQPGAWRSAGRVPPTDDDEAAVMLALGGDPGAIDDLERNTGLAPARLGAALGRLERAGRIQRMRGLWWPR